jgi:hypothetical protein
MDIQQQAVKEYLIDGIPYRALAKKYYVSPHFGARLRRGFVY